MDSHIIIPVKYQRYVALGESFLVAVIWASSFVLVKAVLNQLGPLTIAGIRYFGAYLLLLPFIIRNGKRRTPISKSIWIQLLGIGLSAYALGNGALFWGMKFLSATTASFIMGFIPLLILFAGILWLKEIPTMFQVFGVIICLIGTGVFFYDGLAANEPAGLLIVSIGIVGFVVFGILGRAVARDQKIDTLTLTAIPLALGGGVLLCIAFLLEGIPEFTLTSAGIVIWLAGINTAFAYLLYNHALRILSALEMNVMLNLSPLLTAWLAWLFLADQITVHNIAGIIIVIIGVFFVQRNHTRRIHPSPAP